MMRDNQVFENGKTIPKKAPDFFIGAVENPFAPPYDYRPLRLAKKIVAGAQFIQTQLIFNVDRFREFMKRGGRPGPARADRDPGRRRPDQVAARWPST